MASLLRPLIARSMIIAGPESEASRTRRVGRLALGVCVLAAWALGGRLPARDLQAPDPIKSSDLTLRMDYVGRMPTRTNPTSPAAAGSVLLLVDQEGFVYRWDGANCLELLTLSGAPAGITAVGPEAILTVAANATGDKLVVVFTSSPVPRGVPRRVSTRPGADAWQVFCQYDFTGTALANPKVLTALQVRMDGHTGGGLTVLEDGMLLFATGDNGDAYEDGRASAQDAASHLSKIQRIIRRPGRLTSSRVGSATSSGWSSTSTNERRAWTSSMSVALWRRSSTALATLQALAHLRPTVTLV